MVLKLIPLHKNKIRILHSDRHIDSLVYILLLLTVQNGTDDQKKFYQ